MKNLREKEAWAYPGTPQIFGYPYYRRNGKSYRFLIWPVHSEGPSEQKPIKNSREKGAWAYPWTAHFLRVPLLSQERGKLQISNLASTFREKFWEKRERERVQGLPIFFGYPRLSQERGKLRISNFACTLFMGSIGTKAH